MSWSSAQYSTFEAERTRPVRDLVQAIPAHHVTRAVDLGCGPGNSTEVMLARWPTADIHGIDNSADMVAAARKRLPGTRFELADILQWNDPGPFDLILSNAVLQWVPGHATLLPRLVSHLAPGGTLAIQVPDNLDEPAHRLMRDIAAEIFPDTTGANAAAMRNKRETPEWYFSLLHSQGVRVDMWRTTYFHVLPGGADAVVEWFKGSGLRPFLAPLDDTQKTEFLRRYRDGIAREYQILPDGAALLPFPRLFIVATR